MQKKHTTGFIFRSDLFRSVVSFSCFVLYPRLLIQWFCATRTVVGIDFGAAFGFGSSELPVPELIPFRLTNQFQNLLQPLDSVGLLKG